MSVARAGHSATLFADGRVLIAGGDAMAARRCFDVYGGQLQRRWRKYEQRAINAFGGVASDGRVLIVGGRDAAGNELSSGEIFDTPAASFLSSG